MFRRVCLGGTFNIIHDGHLALLRKAVETGQEVHIGLTTDAMALKARDVEVRDYDARKHGLEKTLKEMGCESFFIFPLDDPAGPAATGEFDAIVVSRNTLKGAEKINAARERNGLEPLEIIVIDMVLARDGEPISSTGVREGRIDTRGKVKTS